MATLKEYFDFDLNKCLTVHKDWEMRNTRGEVFQPIVARISQDFDGNAKYWSCFVPEGADVVGYVNAIFAAPETANCLLGPEGDTVYVQSGFADYSGMANSATLVFTKRILLYVDEVRFTDLLRRTGL